LGGAAIAAGGDVMDMSNTPVSGAGRSKKGPVISLDAVKALLDDGKSIDEIANDLQVSKQGIYNKISRARVAVRRRAVDINEAMDMAKRGKTLPEIAAHFGTTCNWLNRLAARRAFRWADLMPRPAAPQARPVLAAPPAQRIAPPAPELPQGYIAELIETKGKYEGLEKWRAKFGPLIGRDIGAAKALQEWHRYRSV
jgi:hypothetical protein